MPNPRKMKSVLKHCKENNVRTLEYVKNGNMLKVDFDTLSAYRAKMLKYDYKTAKLTIRRARRKTNNNVAYNHNSNNLNNKFNNKKV